MYRDPTMDAAQHMEVLDKRCEICTHNQIHEKFNIEYCTKGKRWPDHGGKCRHMNRKDKIGRDDCEHCGTKLPPERIYYGTCGGEACCE